MHGITLIAFLVLILSVLSFGKYPVVCEDLPVGTTVYEILNQVIPAKLIDSSLQSINLSPSILKFHLPLSTWMTDIVFSIHFPKSEFSYKEIYILQENYSHFNYICHYLGNSFSWIQYFCRCPADQSIESNLWKDKISLDVQNLNNNYCIRKAYCYKADQQSNTCAVNVDPFRKSCILIHHDELEEEKLSSLITYESQYPKLIQILPSKSQIAKEDGQDITADIINLILQTIPYYPFLLILGFAIILNAEEIAETIICQKVFEGLLGITFALVILYFVAQSFLTRVLSRYNDYFLRMVQFPLVFSIISFVWYNPSSLAIIRDLLFEFWDKGAFGFPLLGKIYFASCIIISWSISSYFGWFETESKLWPIILYGVRFSGLVLLSQSTSNRELSMILVFIGCMVPYILESLYYFKYSFIVLESLRQRRRNGKKVTETELQRVTRIKTQNELAKLRNLLRNNPRLVHKTNEQFFEGEKNRQIELLNRFVSGSYSGLPGEINRDDDDIADDLKQTTGFIKYLVYVSIVLVAVVIAKYYKKLIL